MGPRGGMIFCKPELAKKIDYAVFPHSQGGPLMHIIAAKAQAGYEACQPEFAEYIHNVVANSKAMAEEFKRLGYKIVSDGTDNHLFLVDLTDKKVSGRQVQEACDANHITLNKNAVKNDPRPKSETSGIRIGTAAMTTLGYTKEQFIEVARQIDKIIRELENDEK